MSALNIRNPSHILNTVFAVPISYNGLVSKQVSPIRECAYIATNTLFAGVSTTLFVLAVLLLIALPQVV